MSEHVYIWIPSWGEFQHYKDRDPKWIKNYTRLLNHDAYMGLTFAQRGILHGIWMEYASSARALRGDTLSLTRRLGQKVSSRNLDLLQEKGFIQLVASDLLAKLEQNASPEVEKEKEVEKETPEPEPEPEANYAADQPDDQPTFVTPPQTNGAGAAAGDWQHTEEKPSTLQRKLKEEIDRRSAALQ